MDDDKRLIELVLKFNDYSAYGKLIEKYGKDLFSYIYRITGNYHLTEDIVQEAFIKAFRYLKKFDLDKDFLPWILKIAKNTAYTYLKKQKIYYFQGKEINYHRQRKEEDFLSKTYFFQIIESLSKEEQELLVLRFVLELSHKQIAQITGLKEGTIRSKISRSLKKLKDRLKKDEL